MSRERSRMLDIPDLEFSQDAPKRRGGAAPPSLRCRIFLWENVLCGKFKISDLEFSQDAHSWGGEAAPLSLDPFDVFRLKIEKGDMRPKSEAAG